MVESASRGIQQPTASINNEDQNTQKEANISGEKENKNDKLVIEIREMFKRPQIQSSTQCRIYKVPRYLRKWNEEAYTPQVISIGPYHHENQRLKAMEEHKERYFRSFMKRSERSLECLVDKIRGMEGSIRECYLETIDLTSDSFVKMILVDACFILELFIREYSVSQTSYDPMLMKPWAKAIMLDLLLIENQLPFFVIGELHQLAFPPSSNSVLKYDDLVGLSLNYFSDPSFQFRRDSRGHLSVKIEHFTDLLRTCQIPPPEKRPKRDYQKTDGLLYTATHLHEAGVKFEVVASECFSNIKFEKKVLKIPKLELDDWTEFVFRNFMALEQTHYMEDTYLTDYLLLMDSLINTREDVDLLCKEKILVNSLGDNNAAMSMINNLNRGIIRMMVRDDYSDLYNRLNSFYENSWHRRKASLKREYFRTPWRGASTVAAIILLLLTFIQTAFSIFK